jgi:hypothetical protein
MANEIYKWMIFICCYKVTTMQAAEKVKDAGRELLNVEWVFRDDKPITQIHEKPGTEMATRRNAYMVLRLSRKLNGVISLPAIA